MDSTVNPRHVVFDATPEIFATDATGSFWFPLLREGRPGIETEPYDEVRFMVSVWHPSQQRTIDLDKVYVELRGGFDPAGAEGWFKLAEIEPVVPAYNAGETFDGWLVLPVFAPRSCFGLAGGGFAARTRLQVRAHAYFVA